MTFTARMYSNLGNRIGIEPSSWRDDAACKDTDPSIFFPEAGESYKTLLPEARAYCETCPVASECLREAHSFDGTFGIWGGEVFGSIHFIPADGQKWRWVECHNCGKAVKNYSGGHPRKWCSSRCRMQAEKHRRTA